MSESKSRSAHATIRGYAYQFDLSVQAIANAQPGDKITVEGVEDIDVFGSVLPNAIQCKYYEAQEFQLKGLRKAILPMLQHFMAGNRWNYTIHAHFGKDGDAIPQELSLDDLKECLTEQRRKPERVLIRHYDGYEDAELLDFLAHLRLRVGLSYDAQRLATIRVLAAALECSELEAAQLSYGAAIDAVMRLSMNADEALRVTTQESFLEGLKKRDILYSKWHQENLEAEKYVRASSLRIKRAKSNVATKRRVVLLDDSHFEPEAAWSGTARLLEKLLNSYRVGMLSSAQPWTVVLPDSGEGSRLTKSWLARRSASFQDGHEDYGFSSEVFIGEPIVNLRGKTGKMSRTSFRIRVVSRNSFETAIAAGFEPHAVFDLTNDQEPIARIAIAHRFPGLRSSQFAEILEQAS